MLRSSSVLSVLLVLLFLSGCGDPGAAVTATVESLCRARLEGDHAGYLENLAGLPLQQQLQNPLYKTFFERQAAQYKKDGYLFVDIYVRDISLDPGIRQAWINFIEKWSRGTATVTHARRWQLEYVDGRWRVIVM